MHFDFTITLGNVAVILAILGVGWRVNKFVMMLIFEHELLIQDYCERKGISLGEIPTRRKGFLASKARSGD
jgi:hypothetical protein